MFEFTHNGQDFEESHFASLCRFGYSNKRSLHTIGFRGIGFKSTFSLGDEVRIITPTLQVAFHKNRFTEPIWLDSDFCHDGSTRFSVNVQDELRRADIDRNLQSWVESAASLLFFRSLRNLQIYSYDVSWCSKGNGPIPYSEWLSLADNPESQVLLIRSDLEDFPEEAKAEIRQERMVEDTENTELPPCTVELVLGLEGRLFVVLPTGVTLALPFGCNAPFVQDPARVKIKDPQTSPTNRWLLTRIGQLAATTILQWLGQSDLSISERAEAYKLLIPSGRFASSLEGECYSIISRAFHDTIQDEPFLLTHSGRLVKSDDCLGVPPWLPDVWTPEQISALFDERHRPILASEVNSEIRDMLARCGYLPQLGVGELLNILRERRPPTPGAWDNLLTLWHAVAEKATVPSQSWQQFWNDICIVPVNGRDCLHSASEVVRLGERKLLTSDEDWALLGQHLLVLDPKWTRFISEQRQLANVERDLQLAEKVHCADRVLESMGLGHGSDVNRVFEQVTDSFFADSSRSDEDCVRLAHIAAALGSRVSDEFQFITRNGKRFSRMTGAPIIADVSSDIDFFVDKDWADCHILHERYSAQCESCAADEWQQWIESGHSGVMRFVPIERVLGRFVNTADLKQWLMELGHVHDTGQARTNKVVVVDDWDFAQEHWTKWESMARGEPQIWSRLLNQILQQDFTYWQSCLTAKLFQVSSTNRETPLRFENIPSKWIFKLRAKMCLEDTRGVIRQPADLLRRTPDTECLLETEPFVRADLDTESTRPLLAALGVRDTPTGPETLVERLRTLSSVTNPPFHEVQKWCHRLDSISAKCTAQQIEDLKREFRKQPLILTSHNCWVRADEVYISSGDDDPDVPLIHDELRSLTLWKRIGVEERPTHDLVIEWLRGLPSGQKLSSEELRRANGIIARFPARVWSECRHWVNLESEWAPVDSLRYFISMQTLVETKHLFPHVRQQIADLRRLPFDVINQAPFCHLERLGKVVKEHIQLDPRSQTAPRVVEWISELGRGISQIVFDDAEKTEMNRELGRRMARTKWIAVSALQSIPHIDGNPAGTGRTTDAVWDGELIYVNNRPMAKLLRPVAHEFAVPFQDDELADVIKTCIERSPEFIREYLVQNFTLDASDVSIDEDLEDASAAIMLDRADGHMTEEPSHFAPIEVRGSYNTSPGNDLDDKPLQESSIEQQPSTSINRTRTDASSNDGRHSEGSQYNETGRNVELDVEVSGGESLKSVVQNRSALTDSSLSSLTGDTVAATKRTKESDQRGGTRVDSDFEQELSELLTHIEEPYASAQPERESSVVAPSPLDAAMSMPIRPLRKAGGDSSQGPPDVPVQTEVSELYAMNAVMETERRLGFVPRDVSDQNRGYDIESSIPETGVSRFLEVKGRVNGAKFVTITRNEILTGLKHPDRFILAMVVFDQEMATVRYCRVPFEKAPDIKAKSVNYDLHKLLAQSTPPK